MPRSRTPDSVLAQDQVVKITGKHLDWNGTSNHRLLFRTTTRKTDRVVRRREGGEAEEAGTLNDGRQ